MLEDFKRFRRGSLITIPITAIIMLIRAIINYGQVETMTYDGWQILFAVLLLPIIYLVGWSVDFNPAMHGIRDYLDR